MIIDNNVFVCVCGWVFSLVSFLVSYFSVMNQEIFPSNVRLNYRDK